MKEPARNSKDKKQFEPGLFVKEGGVLSLSGPGLRDLLKAVLDRGVSFRFQARGFSMSPFIQDGDIITVAPLPELSPRLGEVIAFLHPDSQRLVVHRVVGRREQAWIFRGDNSPHSDGLIPHENLLGLVTSAQRRGKAIHSGLGVERIPIALLSRRGRLPAFLQPLYKLKGFLRQNMLFIQGG